MELTVYNIKGEDTGKKVQLSDTIFGVEPSDHAIYLDVKAQMAHRRQGTHKAKERGEISRTTKKFKRQKGTGGARAGSLRSPIFIGGGRVFGPRPRQYDLKINKKVKNLARFSALSYKARNEGIMVVEDFQLEGPKTKEFVGILDNLKVNDKKSLIVLADHDKSLYLSSRNLRHSKVVTVSELSTYDIVNANNVVFMEGSINKLEEKYKN